MCDFTAQARCFCPVELQGEGQPIRVNGQVAEGVVGVAYRALEALCAAFPGGLTRQQLNDAAGSKDARRALQYLEKVDPWKSARVFASDRGVGKTPTVYRIVASCGFSPVEEMGRE
jgi:hypothetical protein